MISREAHVFIAAIGCFLVVLASGMSSSRTESKEISDAALIKYWTTHPLSPQEYVVQKALNNKWVFIGEYHRIKHDVDLISSLIPLLHAETDVRCLALEFLCREWTEEANALINAEEYDRRKTMIFFKKQFASWAYEEYLNLFKAAWESNRKHAAKRGIFKFVGLHPCLDWELINYGSNPEAVEKEKQKQAGYDAFMAEALEDQVLKKGIKALIYTGIAHATAKFPEYIVGQEPPEQLMRMGNLVYRAPYSQDMFFICLHAPFFDRNRRLDIYPFDGRLDQMMKTYQSDIGFDVVGTPFEELAHGDRSPSSMTFFNFGQLYDGYIMFKTPIRQYVGVTCIPDWITSEEEFFFYWRHLANKEASERISKMSLREFLSDFCAPRPDHGALFSRRFQNLPDI